MGAPSPVLVVIVNGEMLAIKYGSFEYRIDSGGWPTIGIIEFVLLTADTSIDMIRDWIERVDNNIIEANGVKFTNAVLVINQDDLAVKGEIQIEFHTQTPLYRETEKLL